MMNKLNFLGSTRINMKATQIRSGFPVMYVLILFSIFSGCGNVTRKEKNEFSAAEKQVAAEVRKSDSVLIDLEKEDRMPSLDTASKKILLVGDSQAGGIMYPLNDYCLQNGHEIRAALVWFSASDRTLAGNDTLPRLIQTYKPDYIIVVIGLNQVFQMHQESSRVAVQKVVSLFGTIPYAWVGPASWVKEGGISDMYESTLEPGTFFRSCDLPLERAGDGRHPNMKGYRQWMDSVANWLSNNARWRIKMDKPLKNNQPTKFPLIILNAVKAAARDKESGLKVKADSLSKDSVSASR